jgi:transposase
MAFIKTEKKASGTYIRIVESYRDEKGKPRHRTLCSLGKAEDYSKKTLKKIGSIFYALSGEALPEEKPDSIQEHRRINYGFGQVYDKVMQHYGLDKLLTNIGKRHELSYDIYRYVLLMIIERLNDPSSKLGNYNHQDTYLGFEEMQLHHFYRTLNYLSENQTIIQEQIYRSGQHLFNQKLDVVFYDVTTFYFDSDKEDGFRMKGYSKDGKIGKTVIVFGLLIDKDKNPVGYNIYKGGFYEGHTFADAVRKLKDQYEIEKVITVADRGMMNAGNIETVEEESGYEYIIGERLRNLPKSIQEKILSRDAYRKMQIEDKANGNTILIEYLELEYEGRRIITTYSEKRAGKDRNEREERIKKGLSLMNQKGIIERKARRNFLKKAGASNEYMIDEALIERDKQYDGLACIATNSRKLGIEEILDAYKQLYKIEQTFRTFKSYLETRPMFHWTEARIRGHLCLCYIAFTALNYLGNRLRRKGLNISEAKIRTILSKMELSLIDFNDTEYYLRSSQSEDTAKIAKILELKKPPDFFKTSDVNQYI